MKIYWTADTSGAQMTLDAALRACTNAAQRALEIEAREILGLSQMIVPVKTGKLKRSGKVEVDAPGYVMNFNSKTNSVETKPSHVRTVSVSYGNPSPIYANYVHENHRYRRHFLFEPAEEWARFTGDEVERQIALVFRGSSPSVI
jgi:hypothetical protein